MSRKLPIVRTGECGKTTFLRTLNELRGEARYNLGPVACEFYFQTLSDSRGLGEPLGCAQEFRTDAEGNFVCRASEPCMSNFADQGPFNTGPE